MLVLVLVWREVLGTNAGEKAVLEPIKEATRRQEESFMVVQNKRLECVEAKRLKL